MAVLRQILPAHSRPRFRGKARALLALLAGLWFTPAPAQSAAFDEYHVKAVFLFNFTLFTQWPASAFAAPDTPLVIGVLGVLAVAALTIWLGLAIMPTLAEASAVDRGVPWFLTWGMIGSTVVAAVAIAASLVMSARGTRARAAK